MMAPSRPHHQPPISPKRHPHRFRIIGNATSTKGVEQNQTGRSSVSAF